MPWFVAAGACRGNEQLAADQRWVHAIGQRDRDHSNCELEHGVGSIALGPSSAIPPLTERRSHPSCWLLAGGGATRSGSLSRYESPFEVGHLGVVHDPVDHGGGRDVVAEDLAPANGSLLVTIVDARSSRAEKSANIRSVACRSNGCSQPR
jgi:hypothetical protein